MAKLRPLPALLSAMSFWLWLLGTSSLLAQVEQPSPPISANGGGMNQDPASTGSPKNGGTKNGDSAGGNLLKIFWLKNPTTGELVPVPGFTIDEYDKLDRIRRGLPLSKPPNFLLSELQLTGRTRGDQLQCTLTLEVELRDEEWARIPLGLPRAALRSAPSEENWLTSPDATGEGFVLWAKGKAGEKKTLQLEFDYPLEATSAMTRLQLPLPRARRESATISIEGNDAAPRIEGTGIINSQKVENGVLDVACSGFGSLLDLSWRPKTRPAETESWMEAAGAVEVRVDGRRQIRADARLRIRSFGTLAQPLRVRLPRSMRLTPDAPLISPYVRSQVLAQNTPEAVAGDFHVLELTIDPAAPGEFELRLQAESDSPIAPEATSVLLDGFEVLGAKRHWGIIDLFFTSDWYLAAEQASALRRLDVEQNAAADSNFLRARFEYASQPAQIQMAARLPRTLVEPSYEVFIESGQLRLEGVLKYRFRGPSAGRIEVDLADWTLERLSSPDSTFLVDDAEQEGSRLIIPMSPQAVSAGSETTLRLEARRSIGEGAVQLRLPQVSANVEAPAIVRVLSDINLEITPRSGEFKGVSVDAPASTSSLPPQRGQFAYRTRPGSDPPLLAFDVQVRRQSLLLEPFTQLTLLAPRTIAVTHEMRLQAAYEPLREVVLDLPGTPSEVDLYRVDLDDAPLEILDTIENPMPDEQGVIWTRRRFSLPQAMLGAIKLTIQYRLEPSEPTTDAEPYPIHLPRLVAMSPIQGKPHRLSLRGSAFAVEVDAAVWSPELLETADDDAGREARYTSLKVQPQIALVMKPSPPVVQRGNRCDRWWLQTTLSAGARNDRLCIRLGSWTAPLRLRLPNHVDLSSIRVAVDGVEVTPPSVASRELSLAPPGEGEDRPHVAEIWYQCASPLLAWGTGSLEEPELVEEKLYDRRYWQLITPPEWYSLTRPMGWTWERVGGLREWSWLSSGAMEQSDLEQWVGATTQTPPPADVNQYLYSTVSSEPGLTLLFAPRRELWLLALGSVFVLCAMMLYVAWLRSPIVFLALASAAAAVVVWEPHWRVGVAQLVVAALAVSLCIWLLRSLFVPQRTSLPARIAAARSGARLPETAAYAGDSGSGPVRRGSSISGATAPAGPAP